MKPDKKIVKEMLNEAIPSDLGCEILNIQGNDALYVINNRDAWHFIGATISQEEDNYYNTDLNQRTIPKFLLAEAFKTLTEFNSLVRNPGDKTPLDSPLPGIYSTGHDEFHIDIISGPSKFPKWLLDLIKKDVEILDKAGKLVIQNDDEYMLPTAKTFSGNPVTSKHRRLVHAVAFESLSHGELDARKFGIYSAFCTWKDFNENFVKSDTYFEQLVDAQFEYDPNDDYGWFMELALKVQDELLSERIWAPGLVCEKTRAYRILKEGMSKLSSIQMSQFDLMNGMHSSGLFYPLAQLLNLNSWDTYIDTESARLGRGYIAPDSEVYRTISYEVSIIRALADLTEY